MFSPLSMFPPNDDAIPPSPEVERELDEDWREDQIEPEDEYCDE